MSSIFADGTTQTINIFQSGGTIYYNINGGSGTAISFPFTINNTNTSQNLKVLFSNISITSSLQYFVCGSTNIQFGSTSLNNDGTIPVITVSSVTNYPGLIQNGTVSTGYNYIYVYNLSVASSSSSLAQNGGWIGQVEYANGATNNLIINCNSTGDSSINTNCGGIVGAYAGDSNGSLTIIGCYSTGAIGLGGGGIVGYNSRNVTVSQCFSTGSIGSSGGGIVGALAAFAGTTTVTKCFSTGNIAGNGGGIIGYNAGAGTGSVSVTNSYSSGSIALASGGICGSNAVATNISNCYSTGAITSTGGGIYGATYGVSSSASHCYTSGSGSNGGIFAASSSDNIAGHGAANYSEANHSSSGWNSTNANNTLTISNWVVIVANNPYIINIFGYTPYNLTNITSTPSINNTINQTITAGSVTNSGVQSGASSYTIYSGGDASLSINSSTGVITSTSNSLIQTYNLVIYSTYLGGNGYSVTVFNLTITNAPTPAPQTTTSNVNPYPCCINSSNIKYPSYEVKNTIQYGNGLLSDRATNPKFKFSSYSDYMFYLMAQSSKY